MKTREAYDVLVIGHGMAGLCASIAAQEAGADTLVVEKSPEDEAGGNTQFTRGLRTVISELAPGEYDTDRIENAVRYTQEDFYRDLMRMSNGLADESLCRTLVSNSKETTDWLNEHGVPWLDGMYREFYPGIEEPEAPGVLWLDGGGSVAVQRLKEAAEDAGVDFHYETGAHELLRDEEGEVVGFEAYSEGRPIEYRAPSVVVCAGGFEASRERQARYLGEGADLYTIRGSPYNTGEIVESALDVGAKGEGNWSDIHATVVDVDAAFDGGDGTTNVVGYNYGIVVNANGERFIDEGSERFEYGYVLMKRLHEQPDRIGFVIADDDVVHLVDSLGDTEPEGFDSIDRLAGAFDIDAENLERTVEEYNDAVQPGEFTPEKPDGKHTEGLEPPKSNWAVELDTPPYYALPAKTGITFTFGGLKIDDRARVLDTQGQVIPGLYAAGNSTGGFFYENYAGGCGLARASVFGKIAGEEAAANARERTAAPDVR